MRYTRSTTDRALDVPDWMRYLSGRLPGETPHSDDDFFASDSSADYTAVTPTGTADWTWANGVLGVDFAGQSSNDFACQLKALTPTSAPVTIESAFSALPYDADFNFYGIVFTDGTTATSTAIAVIWYMAANGASTLEVYDGTLTALTSGATAAKSFANGGIPLNLMHMRLIWSATNSFKVQFGLRGTVWNDFGIGTESTTITPTHFGMTVSSYGSSVHRLGAFEYCRVYEADLSA